MTGKVHNFSSDTITVTFERGRCLHAEECVRGIRAVFDPERRRWIDPTQGDANSIAAVVQRCPTGAIHFVRLDGGGEEIADPVNRVTVEPDGPLYVRGAITVVHENGQEVIRDTRLALCRCGHSRNRP